MTDVKRNHDVSEIIIMPHEHYEPYNHIRITLNQCEREMREQDEWMKK